MTEAGGHVELVIRTASSLLVGRLAPREAVTILATQTPRALGTAAHLARADPEQARNYAALVRAVEAALANQPPASGDVRDFAAVREDLARLAWTLEGD